MGNKIVNDSEWLPLDGLTLEDSALTTIHAKSNVLVIAGPGAGKTELLAQKACYLLQTNICILPRKILAISFKTDAATNLKERVEKRCGNIASDRFVSMTYDAFAKRLLDRFREGLPKEYQPSAEYTIGDDSIIHNAFEQSGFNNSRNLSPSKLKAFYNTQLSAVKLPIDNKGIKEKAWLHLIAGDENTEPSLTFQMISQLAEYIIRTNPLLKKALLFTYSHVFLDEFQDTTAIQYELVKTCFKNTDSIITAVGDNKQRIMLWAGALETVFDNYCFDFNAVKNSLLMNHRSAPRLVELQKMMYASLNDVPKKISCSPKWKKDEGEVYLYKFSDAEAEATTIANDIFKLSNSGTALKDICILSKQQPDQYNSNIIEELDKLGIKARIETEYQDLLKEPITILLLAAMDLSLKSKSPDNWELVMNYINIAFAEQISSSYDYFFEQQKSLNTLLKSHKNDLIDCEDKELFQEVVISILDFFNADKIKTIYPVYSQGKCYETTVKKLTNLLWGEYIESKYDWNNALDNFVGLNSIPIMTIHKSKGLEYDAVYFIGLEDSAFWNFRNQPMEDRCAFFVALSRAKKSITFTFSENRKVGFRDNQKHTNIHEFFELLENSEIVDVIDLT